MAKLNSFAAYVKAHYHEVPKSLPPKQRMKWLSKGYKRRQGRVPATLSGGRLVVPQTTDEVIIQVPEPVATTHDGIGIKKRKSKKAKKRGRGLDDELPVEVVEDMTGEGPRRKKKRVPRRGRGAPMIEIDEDMPSDMEGDGELLAQAGGAARRRHLKHRGGEVYAELDPYGSAQYGLVADIHDRAGGALISQGGGSLFNSIMSIGSSALRLLL